MTPKSFTSDRLPEVSVVYFVTDFVADYVTDLFYFFIFQVGGRGRLVSHSPVHTEKTVKD